MSLHNATELADINSSGSGYILTNDERTSISGLDSNGLDTDETKTKGKLSVVDHINFPTSLSVEPTSDEAIYSETGVGSNKLTFKQNDYKYKLDYFSNHLKTGILEGGNITVLNSTQVRVASGKGIVVSYNKGVANTAPTIQEVNWDQIDVTVNNLNAGNPDQLNQWFYVDTAGVIQQQPGEFTDAQYKTTVVLGSAIHSDGTVRFAKTFPTAAYGTHNEFSEFARIFGPLKKTGHTITANGANLSLDRAAGTAFALGRNFSTDANNPSIITDGAQSIVNFYRYYQDGSGGFVLDDGVSNAGYTVLDPTKYDDGSGTLATVSAKKFTTQRLYYFPSTTGIVVAYYGRNEYDSLDAANTQISAEPFTEATNTAQQAIFLGYVIMENTCTDLSAATNSRIIQGGLFRSVAFTSTGAAAGTSNISDLGDVQVTSPANDQILQYNTNTGAWENKDLQDYNSFSMAMSIALGG